jgi:hypothetical protein
MVLKLYVFGLTALAGLSLAACTEPTTPDLKIPIDPQKVSLAVSPPEGDFVPRSNNRYFPLVPGTTFRYRSRTEDGLELESFTVTFNKKLIQGITVREVEDIVRLDGVIIEHTFDWFAQDRRTGNVWYFGEDSRQFDPVTGKFIGNEGSWQAGRDGAQAGIIMWGNPAAHLGQTYNEEHAPGVAEDKARVVYLRAQPTVPYGSFDDCIKTKNFTPLEPDQREEKYYCPGVGLVLEHDLVTNERNKLVRITTR